jgi:predicted AlkP superfamily pyrophosphatase or phosphodiesterase
MGLFKMPAIFSLVITISLFSRIQTAPFASEIRTPTLLISLDGLSAVKLDEYLKENQNSNFQKLFVNEGVKAKSMKPAFPSLTFPNHYTLVTGQNVENHGIVANTVYDPLYDKKVSLLGQFAVYDAQWYNQSDPIWLTAKNQLSFLIY